jgi:hypothetical protein
MGLRNIVHRFDFCCVISALQFLLASSGLSSRKSAGFERSAEAFISVQGNRQISRSLRQSRIVLRLFSFFSLHLSIMETTPLLAAHVNGSSMTSTLVGTIGQTTEERLAGEDHAEIRYFTRYATSILSLLVPSADHAR